MKEIDKLAWLYIKDKKLLGARSRGKEIYYIPGGKRETGETDQEALVREIKEELSVDLLVSNLKLAGIFRAPAHGKSDGSVVKMTCYFGAFRGELRPAAEIEEICWLGHGDKNKSSAVTEIILDWLKENGSID